LNQEEFIIRVVNNNWKPSYVCESDIEAIIYSTSSAAINETYKKLFNTKTRFSGPNVLGFNNKIIIEQLQAEVLFFLFQIIAHDIVIFVTALGSSYQAELNFAGPGYHSSFFYKYHGQRSLIYQSITNTECKIDIYYQENNIRTYTEKSPNDVWSKPDILKNYDGKSLFGLCDQLVIQAIQTYITVPYCKLEFWTCAEDPSRDQSELLVNNQNLQNKFTQFWTCFDTSIKINNCSINGKQRILSIIADSFERHEIREKLKISNDLMDAARKYSRINGPGCIAINKPAQLQILVEEGEILVEDVSEVTKVANWIAQYAGLKRHTAETAIEESNTTRDLNNSNQGTRKPNSEKGKNVVNDNNNGETVAKRQKRTRYR
ncbi:12119_t:CDS:2, partial [Gigaspora rosea]